MTIAVDNLPIPKTTAAAEIIKQASKVGSFLDASINPVQFLANVVYEANNLRIQLTDEELADRRTQNSFYRAVFNAAVVGLIPGSALEHCWFIPYKMNAGVRDYWQQIQLIIGYKGFLELAYHSNYLVQCDPEVVLDGEECRRWHDTNGPQIEHPIPIPRGKECGKDNIIAAYCTYRPVNGVSTLGEVVERGEIMSLFSKASRRSPWHSRFEAMAKKTPIRRTAKRWRLTHRLMSAIRLDEQAEGNITQDSLTFGEDTEEQIDLDEIAGESEPAETEE